jgi:hypothetical protein
MISKIHKKNQKLPEETNQSLNIINNLSNYIVFLISDIIQYINNKDIRSIRVNFSKIDLKELTEFCFQILESLLFCNIKKKEKIKTFLIFDENIQLLKIESDEIRIKQILLNLISNSVKFSNEGEIILKCKLKKIKGRNFVKISVSDTGIGIKKEDIDKLFTEFVQLENCVENIKLGSGLGLSICKNIAKRLGIHLDLKSEYKKGTKIFILIPILNKVNEGVYNDNYLCSELNNNNTNDNFLNNNKDINCLDLFKDINKENVDFILNVNSYNNKNNEFDLKSLISYKYNNSNDTKDNYKNNDNAVCFKNKKSCLGNKWTITDIKILKKEKQNNIKVKNKSNNIIL